MAKSVNKIVPSYSKIVWHDIKEQGLTDFLNKIRQLANKQNLTILCNVKTTFLREFMPLICAKTLTLHPKELNSINDG